MIDVFQGIGVPKQDAKICADVLITADKRGIDSHGIGRLKPTVADLLIIFVSSAQFLFLRRFWQIGMRIL